MTHRALLALLAALSVVGLTVGLSMGLLRDDGEPVREPAALPAMVPVPEQADAPEAPPVQSLAVAWERPLFNPERTPDAQRAGAPTGSDLPGILLTGIVIDGERRVALFKQQGGPSLALKEGATLRGSWKIRRIEARRVELYNDSESHVMQLLTPRLPGSAMPTTTRSQNP